MLTLPYRMRGQMVSRHGHSELGTWSYDHVKRCPANLWDMVPDVRVVMAMIDEQLVKVFRAMLRAPNSKLSLSVCLYEPSRDRLC